MNIKLLQININAGSYLSRIKEFITLNPFDIITLQELAGPNTHCANIHSSIDCFRELQKFLQNTHQGELAIADRFTSDPLSSYLGNAIFYRNDFELIKKNILWLYKTNASFPSSATSFEKEGRNLLHISLGINNRKISILTTHLAWGKKPIEHPYQRVQNKKIFPYLQSLTEPFVLTGDFNIMPNQPTILELEQKGRNLTKEFHIKNTLDSTLHYNKELFPPGIAVDYIFTDPSFKIDTFRVLEENHISDHLGLEATIVLD